MGKETVLEPVIHKHLDKIDVLKEDIEKDIDLLMKGINVKKIIKNPKAELLLIASFLRKKLTEDYIPEALVAGATLSKDLREKQIIKIQKTKDGTLNQELVNDNSRNKE